MWNHCCPGTVGFLETRFESWIPFANMAGFDPDNENQVAMGLRLLQCILF